MEDAEGLSVVHLHAAEELLPLSPDAHGLIVDDPAPGFPECARQAKQLASGAQSMSRSVAHGYAAEPDL
jgi:hypothetical protein